MKPRGLIYLPEAEDSADNFVSDRAFRLKLKEWIYKRNEHRVTSSRRQTPVAIATIESTTPSGCIDSNSEVMFTPVHVAPPSRSALQACFEAEHTIRHDALQLAPSGEELSLLCVAKFALILHRIHETSSDLFYKDLLSKQEFIQDGSTFLHYVAAKGRVREILMDIIRFRQEHNYPIDYKDAEGYTAFHIAVKNDRRENACTLASYGASPVIRNNIGELPLHTHISTSESGTWMSEMLQYQSTGLEAPVEQPSAQAGQVALDLVINRVVRELGRTDAIHCRPATKHILQVVLEKMGTISDHSITLMQAHALRDPNLFSRTANVVRCLSKYHRLTLTMLSILGDRHLRDKRPPCDEVVRN